MGFFNKIKDILFEDEEVEEKVEPKKEIKKEVEKPIIEKVEPPKKVEEAPKEMVKESVAVKSRDNSFDTISERELFKSENTFPFPDFDEAEFSSMSRQQRQKPTTNVLEYEKKKKVEKKYDFGRYERVETREVVEKKKFKPSPIISPVYGILNEDYKIEDIKDKTAEYASQNLDFNSVRKKAFGQIEKLDEIEEVPKETYYEETVTVKLKEDEKEKKHKEKTIDELLEDTADVAIDINKEKTSKHKDIEEYKNIEEELEEIKDEPSKDKEETFEDDDTLENDLFDLIDSMYDNREDGEI